MSTTSSKSSGGSRSSVLSTVTSISSVGSQPAASVASWGSAQPSSKTGAAPRYWCTSCETTFARKYDWKRHEEEFHERYRRYPCPGCNRVFWGANTFNQHHKAAHNCTTCPHAHDVVVYTKRKSAWGCGICAAFLPSRDRFFDHVSKHFESGMTKPDHWTHSRVVYGLLHQPHVWLAWKNLVAMVWGDNQPRFSWNPDTTGRAPGFLENGSPGKLQDFLEFFSENSINVRQLVQLAHDQADVVPRYPAPAQFPHHPAPLLLAAGQLGSTGRQEEVSPTSHLSASQPMMPMVVVDTTPLDQQQRQQQQQQQQQQQPPQPHRHEYRDSDVPSMQAPNPQYMAPLRFTDTIVEVPELEYYDMGPASSHMGPGLPHASGAEDWSSLTATVVDEPMWANGQRYSHNGPGR